jgi:hypothetical protein
MNDNGSRQLSADSNGRIPAENVSDCKAIACGSIF